VDNYKIPIDETARVRAMPVDQNITLDQYKNSVLSVEGDGSDITLKTPSFTHAGMTFTIRNTGSLVTPGNPLGARNPVGIVLDGPFLGLDGGTSTKKVRLKKEDAFIGDYIKITRSSADYWQVVEAVGDWERF
jgi:hypothetical protein